MSRYKSSPWMRIVHGSIGNRVAILFVLVLMSMKTTIALAGIVAEATPVEGTVPIDATTSAVVPQRESETDQQKQRQAQFNWFLDWISPNDEANDYVCSADQVISDNCIYRNDGECDADGDDCEIGTDCIDCDPCRRYTSSCDECVNSVNGDEIRTSTNASCVWCIDSTGTGICSSTALAEVLPLICSPDGGLTNSTFYDTCTDVEPVAPISSITEVPAPTPAYTCDGTVDTCVGANNGYCDKNFFVCRGRNSDW